jgi:hypothetical protein
MDDAKKYFERNPALVYEEDALRPVLDARRDALTRCSRRRSKRRPSRSR